MDEPVSRVRIGASIIPACLSSFEIFIERRLGACLSVDGLSTLMLDPDRRRILISFSLLDLSWHGVGAAWDVGHQAKFRPDQDPREEPEAEDHRELARVLDRKWSRLIVRIVL